jgi:hypothetical protein
MYNFEVSVSLQRDGVKHAALVAPAGGRKRRRFGPIYIETILMLANHIVLVINSPESVQL